MNAPLQMDFRISEEAALWLHRLNHEDTPEARAEFSEWIRKGATHLEEFLFAQAVWKEFDHVDPAMAERLRGIAQDHGVIDLPARPLPARRTSSVPDAAVRKRRHAMGVAAGVAALAAGWLLLQTWPLQDEVYATAVGGQEVIKLDDGSVMYLNTDSRAEVLYSKQERTIRLLAGEAMFSVEQDRIRPFTVVTDNARIRALGTQFNVYRTAGRTTRVSVVDGAVQVSGGPGVVTQAPVKLAAGDEAHVSAEHIVKSAVPDVQRAVAWRARRLVFPGDRIADVAAEFNRYNKVQIRVADPAIQDRRMSGVFDADDPSPFIEHLSRDPDIAVERTRQEITVRLRGK